MASAIDRSPLTPNLEVTQLSGSLGAEIRGITLTEVGPDEAATILGQRDASDLCSEASR